MKIRTCLTICLFVGLLRPSLAQHPTSDCAVLESALREVKQLHAGMHRSDLRSEWETESVIFRTSTIYVYKRCPLVHITVEFEIEPSSKSDLEHKDRITSVSKLYIDYPARD